MPSIKCEIRMEHLTQKKEDGIYAMVYLINSSDSPFTFRYYSNPGTHLSFRLYDLFGLERFVDDYGNKFSLTTLNPTVVSIQPNNYYEIRVGPLLANSDSGLWWLECSFSYKGIIITSDRVLIKIRE
jgi:hypothetical protein